MTRRLPGIVLAALGLASVPSFALAQTAPVDPSLAEVVIDFDDGTSASEAAGLTRAELASLLAVTTELVVAWESGAEAPDRATVALLGALALEALEGLSTTRDRLRALALAAAEPAPGAPVTVKVLPSAA